MKIHPFKIPKNSGASFDIQVEKGTHLYDFLHNHQELQLTLLVKSSGTLFIGEYVGDFNDGDMFIIGSNVPHLFKNDQEYYEHKDLKAHSIHIFFDPQVLGNTFLELPEFKDVQHFFQLTRRCLKVNGKTKDILIPLFHKIPNEKGFKKILVLFQILESLSQSNELEILSYENMDKEVNENEGKRLNDIFQFTFNEYHREISLKEAAGIVHMTPSSFCRFFKQRTRKTYLDFLTEIRISNACKLLLQKKYSITEICFLSGFNNVSNFNRKFKRFMGMNPSSYTKVHRV
ncbi:AraC family transcriptional regulator [Flexithrix dorotheae]|uniref:AraC family transcriptional regulator n=1 Tax=Flexithrix dorotheae TaxID=70993 RepID=UPI00037BC24B|nr:AraC family transcriptional regulator [Flexithrix dorotheae]